MKNRRAWIGFMAVTGAVSAAGCSHAGKTPVYGGSTTGTAVPVSVSVQKGRIISVRDVVIKNTATTRSSTSSSSGALVTAVRILSGSVTAIAGAVGDVIESAQPADPGEEITIALDNGGTVVLVQRRSTPPLAPDERVLVQKGLGSPGDPGGGTRVVREFEFAGT